MIGKIIYCLVSDQNKIEHLQQQIRDMEWAAIVDEIPHKSSFLDVGCGAGYAMYKAKTEKECSIYGIDPDPGGHGVGRFFGQFPTETISIHKGFAEELPFETNTVDVVYSSHVLEHVNDEQLALQEMKRVLKEDGVVIIGMPTATMAWINWFSQIVFASHVRIYEFFRFFVTKNSAKQFVRIFRIKSHSSPRASSIWYDINHYRVSNWKKIVAKEFTIEKVIQPCLYPYPDYTQWFRLHKNRFGSSSVFFICRKNLK